MFTPRNDPPVVWVLCGGPSSEFAVSIDSGHGATLALDKKKYSVVPVFARQDNVWWIASKALAVDSSEAAEINNLFASFHSSEITDAVEEFDVRAIGQRFQEQPPDCVLNLIHGELGEDGVLQGMLEVLRIPYTGSGVLASAVTMDKVLTLQVLERNHLLIPPNLTIHFEAKLKFDQANEVFESIGLPCFVKPSNTGSSIGISLVEDADGLLPALEAAAKYSEVILIEKKIEGMEVSCGVLDEIVDNGIVNTIAFPPTEIVVRNGSKFFDYDAKYTPGATDEITPARVADDVLCEIQATAQRAHGILGCEGMSRVDMIFDGKDLYVFEINSVPGMTGTSLLPQGAKAHGFSMTQLMDCLVQHAWWKFS